MTYGTATQISNFEMTSLPLPEFLLEIDGDTILPAGECAVYDVKWSLSYVDENDIVLWIPLPDLE